MSTQPYVFIIDDDEAVRNGLEMVIGTLDIACQTFVSGEDFLEKYIPGTSGCIVLDLNMPGMNGDELQAELNRRNIRLPIIFLTAYGDIPMSVRVIKAGAIDFLTKPVQIKALLERIQLELQNEADRQEQSKDKLKLQACINSLTPREMEILPLAIAGIANKEIAKQLGISYRTIESHRTQILKKTDTTNFLELSSLLEKYQFAVDLNHR